MPVAPRALAEGEKGVYDRHRPEPDIECDASQAAAVQKQPPGGWLRCLATLDELLSDDMITPVLRSAGYEPDEFRELMTGWPVEEKQDVRATKAGGYASGASGDDFPAR